MSGGGPLTNDLQVKMLREAGNSRDTRESQDYQGKGQMVSHDRRSARGDQKDEPELEKRFDT